MNASPSPPAGSPHSWLAHAKSDLRITQICRSDSGVLPNQTVFHAQQAAEKAIKAVLLEHKILFPRTHDLGELIVLIQQHAITWPFAPDQVEALSPFAVETRYPNDTDPLSERGISKPDASQRPKVSHPHENRHSKKPCRMLCRDSDLNWIPPRQ
jgi:HEPN domain-containing protein